MLWRWLICRYGNKIGTSVVEMSDFLTPEPPEHYDGMYIPKIVT